MKGIYIGYAFGIFAFSNFIRFVITVLISLCSCYSFRENLFVSFSWQPKGTVTATLGSVIYTTVISTISTSNPFYEEYKQYGL